MGEKLFKKNIFISPNNSIGKLDILEVKIKKFSQVFNYLDIKVVILKFIYIILILRACFERANQLFLDFVKKGASLQFRSK